jgi:Tfp pilus assembly protein FimT
MKTFKGIFCYSGYTLAEVVVVLCITVIFLGFTLVFPCANRQKLDAAAAVVAEDIRLAQQLNMNQDAVYTILFDCHNDLYYIQKGVGSYKKVQLPHGIDLVFTNFDSNKLRFNAKGNPNSGGHLSLRDKNGSFRYVIVASLTGRVRTDKIPPS